MEDSNSSPDYDIPATDYEEQHTESTGSDEYEVPDSVIRDRQRDYTVISRVGNWEYAGKHELNSTYLFEKQKIAPSKPDGIEEPKNLHEICRDLIKSSQGILSIINLVSFVLNMRFISLYYVILCMEKPTTKLQIYWLDATVTVKIHFDAACSSQFYQILICSV